MKVNQINENCIDSCDEEEEKEFEPLFGDLKKKIDLENELKEMEKEEKVIEVDVK